MDLEGAESGGPCFYNPDSGPGAGSRGRGGVVGYTAFTFWDDEYDSQDSFSNAVSRQFWFSDAPSISIYLHS